MTKSKVVHTFSMPGIKISGTFTLPKGSTWGTTGPFYGGGAVMSSGASFTYHPWSMGGENIAMDIKRICGVSTRIELSTGVAIGRGTVTISLETGEVFTAEATDYETAMRDAFVILIRTMASV